MLVPHRKKHHKSALALYKQRKEFLNEQDISTMRLARVEKQLRTALHVLSHFKTDESKDEPSTEPDVFLTLAKDFCASDINQQQEAFSKGCTWLTQEGPKQDGALQAFVLIQPDDSNKALPSLYRDHEELRPLLLELWRKQRAQVDVGLLNRAELQRKDHHLQRQALAYGAENPQIGIDLFKAYYKPLLASHIIDTPPSEVTDKALWGGFLRGDTEAVIALRKAIELEAIPERQAALLRLSALISDKNSPPVLEQWLQTNHAEGLRLLALHGSHAAVAIILSCLQTPRFMEEAKIAWHKTTGQSLGTKPRLSVVGDEEQSSADTMPDYQEAKEWWQENKNTVPEGERWFLGAPLTREIIIAQAREQAGRSGRDLLDLLALQLKRPLGISADAEQLQRCELLDTLCQATMESGE